MDLAVFGNQVSKDKNKKSATSERLNLEEKANSSRSIKSAIDKRNNHDKISEFSKSSNRKTTNVRNFGTGLPDNSGRINLSARSKISTNSGRVTGSTTKNNNNNKPFRGGDLNMFLDLQLSADDDIKQQNRNKLSNNDKEWEEISIKSEKRSNQSGSSRVIPICKKAFESESYAKLEDDIEDELESRWSESVQSITERGDDTERTLTPTNRNAILKNQTYSNHYAPYKMSQEKAVIIIQRWFRRHRNRRKMAAAAMKRILCEKQEDMKKQTSTIEMFDNIKKNMPSSRSSLIMKNSYKKEDIKDKRSIVNESKTPRNVKGNESDRKSISRPSTSRSRISKHSSMDLKSTNEKSSKIHTPKYQISDDLASIPLDSDRTVESKMSIAMISDDVNSVNKEDNRKQSSNRSYVTTIDDILSTIKQLESVDCLTDRSHQTGKDTSSCLKQKGSGWNAITDDIERLLQPEHLEPTDFQGKSRNQSGALLTRESLERHNQSGERISSTDHNVDGSFTETKMNNILRFLNNSEMMDNINESEVSSAHKSYSNVSATGAGRGAVWKYDDHLKLEENSKTALSEVSSKITSLRLELEEKQRSQQMLQKALQQQRELTVRQVKETQRDMEKRLESQRQEYETALQRNHTFIDQLIGKNELLQDKLNKIVVELKEKSEKYEEKIRNLQESHGVDLKKIDAKHAAGEKIRREKWEAEKTKLIKEMTIKGMETEIAQLIAGHKQELRRLKQYYETEMVKLEESAYEKHNRQVEELRKQLYREKEEALQKEHDVAKERFDQEMQRQIQILEGQRKQLYQEMADERERLNLMANKQKNEVDGLRKRLENREDELGESLRLQHQHELEEIQRKYESEIRELKNQNSLEQQIWSETQKKKNEAWMLTREQELRNEIRKKRDEEIERVIEQLERDHSQSKEDLESQYANKIKRAKDKYEAEINELESSERQTKEKYNLMRAEFLELEGEHESLKVIMKQKEKEIDEVKQLYETLHREREHVSDIIRQEFADRLVTTEEENRRLKREQSELKAKLSYVEKTNQEELERIRSSHQGDMAEVHEKVKEAIKRKEENMADLKIQFQNEAVQWQEKINSAEKRSEHLESLLEQQRKQLLKLK